MSVKRLITSALAWALCATGTASAQVPAAPLIPGPLLSIPQDAELPVQPASLAVPDPNAILVPATPAWQPQAPLPAGAVASPFFAPGCNDCCWPVGGNGPIGTELYLQTGPTLPVSGGFIAQSVKTGWAVGGGGKTLFFNPAGDAAWVVDLGLMYQYNEGSGDRAIPFIVSLATDNNPNALGLATVRGLSRVSGSIGLGRDWFVLGPAYNGACNTRNLRYGFDTDFRYGSARLDMNILGADGRPSGGYLKAGSIFASAVIGTHADLQIPFGGVMWESGVRVEWGYTWTHLLRFPNRSSDITDVNILLRTGLRF